MRTIWLIVSLVLGISILAVIALVVFSETDMIASFLEGMDRSYFETIYSGEGSE